MESEREVKRTKNPGVRVVGNRIYDSSNGKTCHQCRQKTMDLAASCKALKLDRQCTMKYCHKCLLNRYGEKAEEVALMEDWTCPKCRGICNCSFCMKKRGHHPTGVLVHAAKATGFSSVSELLQVKGPEKVSQQSAKGIGASPKKSVALNKESLVASPRKPGKENSFDGKCDLQKATPHKNEKKFKKMKREELKEICAGNKDNTAAVEKISPKKTKVAKEISENVSNKPCVSKVKSKKGKDKSGFVREKISKVEIRVKQEMKTTKKAKDPEAGKGQKHNNIGTIVNGTKATRKLKKCGTEHLSQDFHEKIQLPQGMSSISVSGIDLPPEDVGNALQFLEFCSAFGKVLDLWKGQAECVIRELLGGRGRRKQHYSSIIRMHIQLLSVILKDRGEEFPSTDDRNSWLKALGDCISQSEYQLKDFPTEFFEKGLDVYQKMDVSKKLELLNFLCDEALCTLELRTWIDNQNSESVERQKEAKEKITAAKEREKQLKQKLQDEVAKALIARNGAPLSISDHEAIVSQIKAESAQAHSEKLAAMGMLSKKRQRSDAVRTDPIILNDDGCVFWRLKCYTKEPNILLQDVGTEGVTLCDNEKWLAFNAEQKPEIEKYISCLRVKRLRALKCTKAVNQNQIDCSF